MEDQDSEVLAPPRAIVSNNGFHPVADPLTSTVSPEEATVKPTTGQPNEKLKEKLNEKLNEKPNEGKRDPRPALFWSAPVSGQEELNWFVPPLPSHEQHQDQTEELLDRLGAMMGQQPRRAWLLKWNFHTRAAATGRELTDIEEEAKTSLTRHQEQSERDLTRLDAKIALLRESRERLEADLIEAKKDFAESAARAGLNCSAAPEPDTPKRRRLLQIRGRSSKPPTDKSPSGESDKSAQMPDEQMLSLATIRPHRVEEALDDARPSLQEMAGEHGIGPVDRADFLSTLLQFFMQFLAPLVAGLMLALSLGTLVGLVDIDTLQRADGAPQLALCAALGFVIVYLMGEVYHAAVAALARSLETRQQWEGGSHLPVPRLKASLGIAVVLMSLAALLGLAEITAEGMGIRQLHNQQVARQQRFRTASQPGLPASDSPLYVYMLIGTLISLPYLVYKSAKGWAENEHSLREAWLSHRQRVWMEERRAEPSVQQTFHNAYVVEHLENSLQTVKAQLREAERAREEALHVELPQHIQARKQSARAAAVGEAARLQQMVEELVESTEPLPRDAERGSGPSGKRNSRWNGFGKT